MSTFSRKMMEIKQMYQLDSDEGNDKQKCDLFLHPKNENNPGNDFKMKK